MTNAQTEQSVGCQCLACEKTSHASDCAVHNAPAYPIGECDCGAQPYPENFINALKYDVARRDSEQKDAARWRFLVDNSFDKDGVTQFHVWEHSWEPHSQTGEPTEWKQRVRGPALDHFIDRAIEAAHGIKENT